VENFILKTRASWRPWNEKIPYLFLGACPLFVVTLRPWSSAVLILGAFFCLVAMLFCQPKPVEPIQMLWQLIPITFVAPVLMIAISSSMRGRYILSEYDSASRFFVAVAIFMWSLRQKISIARVFEMTIPLSLFITLLHQLYVPQPHLWGNERMSTYFSDPLVFGYTSLTLGLMSLVSISALRRDSRFVVAIKLLATFVGFYLSIQSGSRTGWLAVPVVLVIWLRQSAYASPSGSYWGRWILAGVVAVAFIAIFSSNTVNQRLALALLEFKNYSWTGIAPETSVGFRITFLRIATDMFMSNPFIGFGDTRCEAIAMPPQIYLYASPESIRLAMTAGFHNEIVTNAIHFGIGGLVATLMLFLAPLSVFASGLDSKNANRRANALLGLVFTLVFFVSSFSTEVFDLKYTASFYALMVAVLSASSLVAKADAADRVTNGNKNANSI
jgi:O-antigen ligase